MASNSEGVSRRPVMMSVCVRGADEHLDDVPVTAELGYHDPASDPNHACSLSSSIHTLAIKQT